MVEELIPQVSAVFTVGLITGLIAYYVVLCKRVREFIDEQKEKYAEDFSEFMRKDLEKLMLGNQPMSTEGLDALKEFLRKSQLQSITLSEKTLFEAYDTRHALEAMRNSLSISIISFVITISLSFTVYSSYAVYSFTLALLFVLYGVYLFVKVSDIFFD